MLHCPKCDIDVIGNKDLCPLCQGELSGKAEREPYKYVRPEKYSRNYIFRIISFISIAVIIVSVALNIMIPSGELWCIFVAGGTACIWAVLSVGFTFRKRIYKNLTFQLFFATAACVLWDVFTGWEAWSVTYVLPLACIAYMISVFILSKLIKGLPDNAHMIYLVIDTVYGLVPIVFLAAGLVTVTYPSISCIAVSLISIIGVFIFDGKALSAEIVKKFHI